jgi:hypothetical protein
MLKIVPWRFRGAMGNRIRGQEEPDQRGMFGAALLFIQWSRGDGPVIPEEYLAGQEPREMRAPGTRCPM